MKIIHCCLADFYVDGFGYQENIIPRIHKHQGHEVMILASTEIVKPGEVYAYVAPGEYLNEDGIPVKRVSYKGFFPIKIMAKIRWYNNVFKTLKNFAPDIIFMHDAQTAAVFSIIKYLKENPKCRLYIDSHTDFVNSAKTWVSKYLLHGILYKWYVRKTIPFARRYYGTLPARVAFYRDFYGTPADKTEYLPLGVDDVFVPIKDREQIRDAMRKNLGFCEDDFIVVCGGKLESRKNILQLMKSAVLLHKDNPNVKLLLFGSVSQDIKKEFDELLNANLDAIKHIGWVPSKETYKYFFASDIACFPGTHSTLWEESVGLGLPIIAKRWDGIDQIDLDGNAVLIKDPITVEAIANCLESIIGDKNKYNKMKMISMTKGMSFFSYSRIAEYAINQ